MDIEETLHVKSQRSVVTLVTTIVLWLAIVAALLGFFFARHNGVRSASALHNSAGIAFNHVYPPDPVPFERPAVGTISPYVNFPNRVHSGVRVTSIAAFASAIQPGTLYQLANGHWLLSRPVQLGTGTSLVLKGPLQIDMMPGSFLLAEHGAVISLTGVSVTGVTKAKLADASPSDRRGFIDARSGSQLLLTNDHFMDLGYLGDQTYGVTMDGASPKSAIVHCSINSDYFGVYIGKMMGVDVTGNTVANSVIYGIDPHTHDANLVITHNVVTNSGVHGIVVADFVSNSHIDFNTVTGSHDHGIVIYQYSNGNTIEHNIVSKSFDGIVVSDSSQNVIRFNSVQTINRFAIRIAGQSNANQVSSNSLRSAIVGIYVYRGASHNQIDNNTFRGMYENVRVRSDAPFNQVSPNPGRSEL